MLTTLRDITQAVAGAASLEEALTLLVRRTNAAMQTHCCSVYLLEQGKLLLSATDGLAKSAVGQVTISLGEGLVGTVAQRGELLNLAQAQSHPRFKVCPEVAEDAFQAFLAAPIIYQQRLLGVILVQQEAARQFSEGEEAFLLTLAAQLAMAINNVRRKRALPHPGQQSVFRGTCASRGIAIAKGLVLGGEISLEQAQQRCDDITAELMRLEQALSRSKAALTALLQRFEHNADDEVSNIVSALIMLLDEQSLGGEYLQEVQAGWQAESAVSRVSMRYIAQFAAMDDAYLKERARDIRELGQRVLRQLIEPGKVRLAPDKPVILIAREVDIGLLVEFPQQKLAGIVTELGGVNAHVAIVARALGVPALTGVEAVLDGLEPDTLEQGELVLNASRGQLLIGPSAVVLQEYRALLASEKALARRYAAELTLPAETLDKQRIHLHLNAGLISGMENTIADGADGIGLYRTEIPFMLEQRFPSESEQVKVYRQVRRAVGSRPVVMRTLDIGGDKPLPYFPIKEENPFLGWRGIRLSLDHPELFLVQLRAMMRAFSSGGKLSVLFPMVSSVAEIDMALCYFNQAFAEVKAELDGQLSRPRVGIMLEVPALLYQLREVALRVDFVSVGTNDLTQYLLAVDRNNPSVSSLFDSFHPALLRALQRARFDCGQYGLDVSVCGELAGEPMGALLLVAMGYSQLSMNQGSLARINYLLRRVSCGELSNLLDIALEQDDAQDVREIVREYLDSRHLLTLVNQ